MITNLRSSELVRVAREGTAEQYVATLKETGSAVLGNALEVFSKMDRETEEGRISVDQLKDLKNSLIAHIDRNQKATQANEVQLKADVQAVNAGSHPSVKLAGAKTEELTNEASQLKKGGPAYANLKREVSAQEALVNAPEVDAMSGAKKFLADLTAVQGIFAAAALVPGPLSLTVKNVAKELYSSQSQTSGSVSGSSQASGAGVSLLALGAGGFSSESNFSGQVNSQSGARYEKVTLDERIIPVLGELQDRLSQATVVPATQGIIEGRHNVTETEGKSGIFGGMKFKTEIATTVSYYDHRIKTTLASQEFQPAHVRLPETSISDYTK